MTYFFGVSHTVYVAPLNNPRVGLCRFARYGIPLGWQGCIHAGMQEELQPGPIGKARPEQFSIPGECLPAFISTCSYRLSFAQPACHSSPAQPLSLLDAPVRLSASLTPPL